MTILMNYDKNKELDLVKTTLASHPQRDIALGILTEIIDDIHKLFQLARASNSPSVQRSLNQFLDAVADDNSAIFEISLECLRDYAKKKPSIYHQAIANEATALLKNLRFNLLRSLRIPHVLAASTYSVGNLVFDYVKRTAEHQRLAKSRHYDHNYARALLIEYSNKQRVKTDITEASRTYKKWKDKGYFK